MLQPAASSCCECACERGARSLLTRGARSSSELPNFFASTKFFACLDLIESQELFESTQMARPPPPPAACPALPGSPTHELKARGTRPQPGALHW